MLPLANAAAFALAALALIVIPGPSVLFVIGRSLALGRRGGLISVLGNALGTLPAVAAVSFGLGQVIADSLVVFLTIKIAGALYLMYLGVQAIRHRREHASPVKYSAAPAQPTLRLLREGIVVGVSNPKTIVFFVAVLPQFVDRSSGAIPVQLALLGCIFAAIALISDSTWAVVAGTARTWFGRNPERMTSMTAGGGVMMIGLGGVLAATGNKH